MELFEQQQLNESFQIITTKQTPSQVINVQIHLFDTRYNTSGLIRVLVSRSRSNCTLGYKPAAARPTDTRRCICTRVQPTFLYLYTCSTHISLSVQVFNLHFSICTRVQPTLLYLYVFNLHFHICTGVQPTLLYLYTCSNYTSLSVQVFNLHFSIYTRVQPTLFPTAVSTSFTHKSEKPKELGNLEQLILPFLGDQSIDFAVMLNFVGLTSCIGTV